MIRNFLTRFMYGRYGSDQLNLFLSTLWLVLYVLSIVFRVTKLTPLYSLFYGVAFVFILWSLFRMLSRNYDARRRENDWYLTHIATLFTRLRKRLLRMRDRSHKYYHCPSCGAVLRVPRGKGRVNIHCRSCGTTFQKKT